MNRITPIEITQANGVQTTVDICFLCHKFIVDEGHLAELPPNLKESLSVFFASVGMKPKTDDEYDALIAAGRLTQTNDAEGRKKAARQ